MTEINHDPNPNWQYAEHAMEVGPMPAGAYGDLLGRAMSASLNKYKDQLARSIYEDPFPFTPPTRWQRFKNWLGDNRITNAWLVLIGREDIDRGDY